MNDSGEWTDLLVHSDDRGLGSEYLLKWHMEVQINLLRDSILDDRPLCKQFGRRNKTLYLPTAN